MCESSEYRVAALSQIMILKGWKDIAKYLGCGIRTVQRWQVLGLPVRRPAHRRRSAVVAVSEDLDAWLRSEPGQAAIHHSSEHKGDASPRFMKWTNDAMAKCLPPGAIQAVVPNSRHLSHSMNPRFYN